MYEEQVVSDFDQVEALTARLVGYEKHISEPRAEQAELVSRLDRMQMDLGDGYQDMTGLLSATLDVSYQTATRLLGVARADHGEIRPGLRSGRFGLDRAFLLSRLSAMRPEDGLWRQAAEGYSLGRLWGLLDRLRRVDSARERFSASDRFLVMQPSLDEDSAWRYWGQCTPWDGHIVEEALTRRADLFPDLPDQTRGGRMADALTSLCLDSLTTTTGGGCDEPARAVTVAEIFVDATLAVPTGGEAGVTMSSGLRGGANLLEEVLCAGKVRVNLITGEGPVGSSAPAPSVPPAVRRYVWFRDQGRCSAEGCSSRYRLEAHHLRPRSEGGDHRADNLSLVRLSHESG